MAILSTVDSVDNNTSLLPSHRQQLSLPSNGESSTTVFTSSAASPNTLSPSDVNLQTGGKSNYDEYLKQVKAVWSDLPNLTIEYRNLSYTLPIPIVQKPRNLLSALTSLSNIFNKTETIVFKALRPVEGSVEPGQMTLILAPPGHGKSLLLKSLAGRLVNDNKSTGLVTYNGLTYQEALQQKWHIHKLTGYVDQVDTHIAQLTVKETFEFAVMNSVADISQLSVDEATRLKVDSRNKASLLIDLLGLREAENTIIGNDLLRGVSGGQRRRVTIGEILASAARALFLDEITTGLDSAAAFDVCAAIGRWVKIMNGSAVMALLQPAPALYELFDNLILMREGTIVYSGPRSQVISYLSQQGVIIPTDQDESDFLIDFLSFPETVQQKNHMKILRRVERSQSGYISRRQITPNQMGRQQSGIPSILQRQTSAESVLQDQLQRQTTADSLHLPNSTRQLSETEKVVGEVTFHEANGQDHLPIKTTLATVENSLIANSKGAPLTTVALEERYKSSAYYAAIQQRLKETQHLIGKPQGSFTMTDSQCSQYTHAQYRRKYIHSIVYHTSLNLWRQFSLLVKTPSFWGPRIVQSIFMGLVLGSVFYNLSADDFYNRMGVIIFSPIILGFGTMSEVPLSAEGKMVVYRHVDSDFYPVTSYVISVILVYLPLQVIESALFGTIIYWMSNFVSLAGNYFFFILCMFMLNLVWAQIFRYFAYAFPNAEVAQQMAVPWTALNLAFAGFLITEGKIPDWLVWVYWLSPFSWLVRSVAQNEFLSSRYDRVVAGGTLGKQYLSAFEINTDSAYKWGGIGYLAGIYLLFVLACIYSLSVQRSATSMGTRRDAKQEEKEWKENQQIKQQENNENTIDILPVTSADQQQLQRPVDELNRQSSGNSSVRFKPGSAASSLPFEAKNLSFRDLCYSVQLTDGSWKQLLRNVSGFAQAGQCTALMGASGAGKSTLMDVIAGRKTAGKMTGEILIDGFPKENATFNRLCGYVEQNDIHMANCTVKEALLFSAKLRLPSSVTNEQREAFIGELLDLLELKDIQNRLVTADTDGLSPGQMKRLTIGVELAANPSILFLDEPTSGLDSRAALLVMKVMKRVVQSGRTILCTIHQPSTDIFFQFDRLLLLASGGRTVYFGDIGYEGDELINYFQSAPVREDQKVPIGQTDNPATWMLEFIGAGTAVKKQDTPDYATIYLDSSSYQTNLKELDEISQPKPGSQPASFNSVYASDYWTQFIVVLQRFNVSYFRDVAYNFTRLMILLFLGILYGLLWLQIDSSDSPGLQSKRSAIFMAMGTTGVINCASALPVVSRNRAVFYRERASYAYTSYSFSTAIAIIELPYILLGVLAFSIPFYWMVGLRADGGGFFLFLLIQYLNAICFNYWGQLLVSILPNMLVTHLLVGPSYAFIFLFGGAFIIPPAIPKGWIWVYYLSWMPKSFLAAASHEFACESSPCPSITLQDSGSVITVQDFVGTTLDVGFDTQEYWKWFGWLMLTIAVLRLLTAVALQKIVHMKR